MKRSLKEAGTLEVGSLLGDLKLLSKTVRSHAAAHDVAVWINAGGDVFVSRTNNAPALTSDLFVGTYGLGINASQIYDDLAALRHERVAGAIIFR
ncbi:hypothetical protein [Dokdonella ginsengisoli]|uniref:Uncharacterized protein n=1 Tax=Dokdonella ginsengisoli TaxID=363846 RepID=A0ABV9QZM6_9GAMM